MLFSSSLENHMKAYAKDQELKYFNDQFQLEQSKIVQEGIRMQLSQLEIMNQIKQMQESLKANIAGKMIPKSATDSPEAPIKPKEEYRIKINKKPIINLLNKSRKYNKKNERFYNLKDEILKELESKKEKISNYDEVLQYINKIRPTHKDIISNMQTQLSNLKVIE